jgi:hypothetical protein
MIATSQSSPPLMYLDGDDEVKRLLDVSYTFTVWNVYCISISRTADNIIYFGQAKC